MLWKKIIIYLFRDLKKFKNCLRNIKKLQKLFLMIDMNEHMIEHMNMFFFKNFRIILAIIWKVYLEAFIDNFVGQSNCFEYLRSFVGL